ncbi:MAG: LLM class flavin-dependent oxidoreductase, partial [Candidatus Xenobia bacterium]
MQLGLQIPNFTWTGGPVKLGETLAGIGKRAEDAGFASVWVMDHFFQIPFVGPIDIDMLEGYTTLAFLAAATKRVKLGTMVTGIT